MNKEVLQSGFGNSEHYQPVAQTKSTIKPTGLAVGFMVGRKELTSRDALIISELGKHSVLNVRQIKTLLNFPSLDRAQRRCLALYRRGLVERIPCFSSGPGKPEFCYILSNKAFRYLSMVQKAPTRGNRIKSGLFLEHTLLINDFWICLELACRANSLIKLAGFIPEFSRGYSRGVKSTSIVVVEPETGRKLTLVPDAVFCLAGENKKKLFFLEIDRATGKVESQSYRSFASQAQKYIWYQQGKDFTDYGKIFSYPFPGFQVLYVTTSENRLKHYQQALSRLGNFQKFVLFATFEKLSPETIFGKIWRASKAEDENLYSLLE